MTVDALPLEAIRGMPDRDVEELLHTTNLAIHYCLAKNDISTSLIALLVQWMRIQLAQRQAKGFVIGISGGIDSATVAALAELAVAGHNRHAFLTCYSSELDEIAADLVAFAVGFQLEKLDISAVYDALCSLLRTSSHANKTDRTEQNLKVMLRTVVFGCLANQSSLLVAGTGNRSEREHVAHFTKRGVAAADNLVLGHLFKSQVCRLGQLLGIPDEVVRRSPSSGLRLLQNGTPLADENELGMTYEEIERATRLFMTFGCNLKGLSSAISQGQTGASPTLLDTCKRLGLRSLQSRHKTLPMPIAGYPRRVVPDFNEYPCDFPDKQALLIWKQPD